MQGQVRCSICNKTPEESPFAAGYAACMACCQQPGYLERQQAMLEAQLDFIRRRYATESSHD